VKPLACPREDELLAALQRGYVPADLAAHAGGCGACGELRLVAEALLDDRAQALAEAPVPAAGTAWWRLQLRLRQDAAAAARRSLAVGQGVTLAAALALLLAAFGDAGMAILRGAWPALRLLPLPVVTLGALAALALVLVPLGGLLVARRR
jgi:hypothetical protein